MYQTGVDRWYQFDVSICFGIGTKFLNCLEMQQQMQLLSAGKTKQNGVHWLKKYFIDSNTIPFGDFSLEDISLYVLFPLVVVHLVTAARQNRKKIFY